MKPGFGWNGLGGLRNRDLGQLRTKKVGMSHLIRDVKKLKCGQVLA